MPDHDLRALPCVQLPDDLVDLVPCIENTSVVLTDPDAPTWRRHLALVQLAEAAYLMGRAAQAGEDFRTVQALKEREGTPVEPTGLKVVRS